MVAQPHAFPDTPQYRMAIAGWGGQKLLSAFVLPTTRAVVAAAERLASRDGLLRVGCMPETGACRAVQILQRLRNSPERPPIVVFTDQLLDQADASILVKTDAGDRYLSPVEAILSANYKYQLLVWTDAGFEVVRPGEADLPTLARLLLRHLDCAGALGSQWEVAHLQALRLPDVRQYNARRKIRFFRSAVINAFRDEPHAVEAIEMLSRVRALEERAARRSTT